MPEQRFWFEEWPEEEKYWFLAPSGRSRRQALEEAEQQAELEESDLTSQDADDLRNVESDVRREIREVRRRIEAIGYGDQALEPPSWPTVRWWEHEEGRDRVERAPILYTDRKQAEEEARSLEAEEAERYLELVERYGQAEADEAWDNHIPYRALWVDRGRSSTSWKISTSFM